jgi:hypothetical protein
MEWWLSGRKLIALALVAAASVVAPGVCAAQSVSPAERESLDRVVAETAALGLPAASLANKIQEGIAKGAAATRIEAVIRQMAGNLQIADQLMRETEPATSPARDASLTLLAESLGSGVTPDEVRQLHQAARAAGPMAVSAESLASAAKGLAFIKDAQLPIADATAVIAETLKRGFRAHEILDVGREVRRRERDYRTGRASLRALRDAIARGDRPDQLFRDSRAETVARPAATRPETQVDRPAARPETPQRPVQVVRPERPAPERGR